MTSSNRSSYIRVEDQNQSALNELFSVVNNPTQYRAQLLSKPFRDRGLPESFFQPPSSSPNNSLSKSAATSSNSISNEQQQQQQTVHRQHAKNVLSLPNIPSQSTTLLRTIINNNHVQGHLRTVSDTAVLDGQGTTMASTNSTLSQINSQVSLLPLPEGWEERQTPDGQSYYIDHITQCTTWIDPRPNHYAAFQSFCTTLPLPDGYEQSRDARGNIYFIDHNLKQTCWDDPRPKYYRSMMTKRLDIPIPPTSIPIPQSSTSPIPTASSSSSPFHQQRLSSSTLSPTTSMAQLTTNSPPVITQQHDPLKNKLSEILNEQRLLQQRKEQLEQMEADVRKMLSQNPNANNVPPDQATIDALIEDYFHHKRQNSEDSGVGEGRNSINRTPDALSSMDCIDDPLFSNQADYATFPVEMDLPVQDPRPITILGDSQLNIKSVKQNHQWFYNNTNI
ncbi:unnamed protein product [Adineta steineri]|uniref:WW domain-containing protein n=1 Tax=Adineta steineri TaxID=433720 RepID=A0A814P377_9BILA|nr:unnamed protein product [Adineta steineri]CAF3778205.1 unnamed protein product [Adineta steineri]